MRNRQMVAQWAYKKGEADKVIEKVVRDGKTYFVINDYDKLRELFGKLLNEIQRIKSEGVTADEVTRAINQIGAETAFDRDGSFSIASQINEAIANMEKGEALRNVIVF